MVFCWHCKETHFLLLTGERLVLEKNMSCRGFAQGRAVGGRALLSV